ncbi:MAG: phospho-N-acetylmuramoyl-pentapeptide-transferase [Lachnospiraceae bacterium]|nr:phospho-N-acetylmuramoyl-pentapeptide-transferase [Lachnospiraceae bacterium]
MSTETVISILLSFLISVILCPIVIPFLHKLKFGQYIREEGPKEHQKKSGTPTMGGLVILSSVVITSLVFIKDYKEILPVLFMTLVFGIIGFLDDYIKVVMKRNLGLRAWQKMALQIVVTGIFIFYLYNYTDIGTDVIIPFISDKTLELGVLFIPFVFCVVVGTVNGANFTDGLDGLASGVTVIISVFFTVIAIATKSGIDPITGAVCGALLGFLLFNVYPAKVFMGDTGSLALGGFVASTAIVLKMPIFLLLVAFIYFAEVLSVIIQVGYFKITKGKRFFKMAPIHHHFELCGWSETRVVAVFTIITALLCLIAYTAL